MPCLPYHWLCPWNSTIAYESVQFRQWTNMVHLLILRFLLVLSSFNLIERCHSMEKRSNFDIEFELFRNLIIESQSRIVDHQQNSWIKGTKNGFLYKLWNKSSRNISIRRPRFEQQKDINNIYQGSTRKPETMKIVSPKNDDRFDKWGG